MKEIPPMSVKTDLSQWYKINKDIKIVPTKKKYYNDFVHKLVYRNIYRAGLVVSSRTEQELVNRLQATSASYSQHTVLTLSKLLKPLFDLYQTRGEHLRIRIESSSVSLFSKDLDCLYKISQEYLDIYNDRAHLLTTVLDEQQQEHLDNNLIIVKEQTDYRYRVSIRDGFYSSFQDRQSLATYLESLGDEIKCTKRFINSIRSSNKYIQIGYFYVRDPRVIDMIRLIIPNLVRRVDQLVVS